MITDAYIDKNKTKSFRKGDRVVMVNCGEAEHFNEKVWICKTDSFLDKEKQELVFLEGFSGSFICKYLK